MNGFTSLRSIKTKLLAMLHIKAYVLNFKLKNDKYPYTVALEK